MSPSEPVPPLLRVRDLSRSFGDLSVLHGVDLDLASGEALALIGPNGSGKSTALRCIAGAGCSSACCAASTCSPCRPSR